MPQQYVAATEALVITAGRPAGREAESGDMDGMPARKLTRLHLTEVLRCAKSLISIRPRSRVTCVLFSDLRFVFCSSIVAPRAAYRGLRTHFPVRGGDPTWVNTASEY